MTYEDPAIRMKAIRDHMAAEWQKLPAVDHNGRPIPPAPAAAEPAAPAEPEPITWGSGDGGPMGESPQVPTRPNRQPHPLEIITARIKSQVGGTNEHDELTSLMNNNPAGRYGGDAA